MNSVTRKDLRSSDPAIRLLAFQQLEKITNPEPEIIDTLVELSGKDQIAALLLKTLTDKDSKLADPLTFIENFLAGSRQERDWAAFFFNLQKITAEKAPLIISEVRSIDEAEVPSDLLPLLVKFFMNFGSFEDIPRLENWCRSSNPAVLGYAVEALNRLQPASLKSLLEPLLLNSSPGIRSRAVRLLYKWNPDDARTLFNNMLFSDDEAERHAALFHSFFFPFNEISESLLVFIARETSPDLLKKAGNLLIINPDLAVGMALADIIKFAYGEKAAILAGVLEQLARFASMAGLSELSPEQLVQQLSARTEQELDPAKLAESEQSRSATGSDDKAGIEAAATEAEAKLAQMAAKLASLTADEFALHRNTVLNSFQLLTPARKALVVRLMSRFEAQQTGWFENVFVACRFEPPVLQALLEYFYHCNPEFVAPYIDWILKSDDTGCKLAAIRILSRIAPEQAAHLLGRLIFSADKMRRRSALIVLSSLEKHFAQRLIIKAFKAETDEENLARVENLLSSIINPGNLAEIQNAAATSAESPARLKMVARVCRRLNLVPAPEKTQPESSRIDIDLLNAQRAVNLTEEKQEEHEPPAKAIALSPALEKYLQAGRRVAVFNSLRTHCATSNARFNFCENSREAELVQETRVRFNFEVSDFEQTLKLSKDLLPARILESELVKTAPDFLKVAASLSRVNARQAKLLAGLLLKADWQCWPGETLPYIVEFWKKAGETAISAQIKPHIDSNDEILRFVSLEALEHLNPDELRDHLPRLLTDSDPDIRLRSIRLLARFDEKEALNYFENSLLHGTRDEIDETLVAAHFFRFELIQAPLFKFLGISNDEAAIQQACRIILTNPHESLPAALFDLIETSSGNKREVLASVFQQLVKIICTAGLTGSNYEAYLSDLQNQYKQRKQAELFRQAEAQLNSENAAVRCKAVRSLATHAAKGDRHALQILKEAQSRETEATVIDSFALYLGVRPEAEPAKAETENIAWLMALDAEAYQKNRNRVFDFLRSALSDEKSIALATIGRFGADKDSEKLYKFIHDENPQVVIAAIAAISSLDAESLTGALPALLLSQNHDIRAAAIGALAKTDRLQALTLLEEFIGSAKPTHRQAAISALSCFDFISVRDLLFNALQRESEPELINQIAAVLRANLDLTVLEDLAGTMFLCPENTRKAVEKVFTDILNLYAAGKNIEPAALCLELTTKGRREAERELSPPAYALVRVKSATVQQQIIAEPAQTPWIYRGYVVAALLLVALISAFMANNDSSETKVIIAAAPAQMPASERFERWRTPFVDGEVRPIFGVIEQAYSDGVLVKLYNLENRLFVRFGDMNCRFKPGESFSGQVRVTGLMPQRAEAKLERLF